MKNILFVHQSAELYGSDKVLLSLVAGIDRQLFQPIVLLPNKGPLFDILVEQGIEVYDVPLIKISRATLKPSGLLSLPKAIYVSMQAMKRILNGKPIHLVHSNTIAILSGALWAKFNNIPHVWHVHEMILHPKPVKHLFPYLLNLLSDVVACNSKATMNLLVETKPALASKCMVIWNGMTREEPVDANKRDSVREKLGIKAHDRLVLLMGRINRWKGQDLLVKAAEILRTQGINGVRYLLVGSPPPNQHFFLDNLQNQINNSTVKDSFSILQFQDEIWPIWDACDIAVIPSTEPEPFGMVALEAMAASKPVIAAGHGGLTDIVIHGETGLLFSPNRAEELAASLLQLLNDEASRVTMGQAGERRYKEVFNLENYVNGFESIYHDHSR